MMRNPNRWISALALLLGALAAGPAAYGDVLTYMIGDDDGFAGTQGANSDPGDPYNTNFWPAALPPGTHTNQTDLSTQSPFTGYKFVYEFAWDASSLASISNASVAVQFGSLGRRNDASGFGFAYVWNDNGYGPVAYGDVLTVNTGGTSGNVDPNGPEETVRLISFDITSQLVGLSGGTFTTTIDGLALTDPNDLFAIDFAVLTIEGPTIPEPASLVLLGMGALAGSRRRTSQHL